MGMLSGQLARTKENYGTNDIYFKFFLILSKKDRIIIQFQEFRLNYHLHFVS